MRLRVWHSWLSRGGTWQQSDPEPHFPTPLETCPGLQSTLWPRVTDPCDNPDGPTVASCWRHCPRSRKGNRGHEKEAPWASRHGESGVDEPWARTSRPSARLGLAPARPCPPLGTYLYSARLLRIDSFSRSAAMARRRCSFSCSISRSDRVLMWFSSTYTSWYFPEVKRSLSWEGVEGP